jgi:DNA-directed RNA polymerase specialized sigma subunit
MDAGTQDVDLDPISALRDERAQLTQRIADIDLELQEHVRAAFAAGVNYREIMAVSGLSRARVYQLQKGTRR